mgnify:CR=1 FL=1|tara:strand:- start:322 stop:1095 length:774 start_codon:yes stop_codon:yes gene_type:complete
MKKIIDFHTHLNHMKFKSPYDALKDISVKSKRNSVELSLVLHLDIQPWPIEQIGELCDEFSNLQIYVDINLNKKNYFKNFENYIKKYNFKGLKLHPRLNKYELLSKKTIKIVSFAGEVNIPVVIDAFPDGNSIMNKFNVSDYGYLANKCPNTNIIAAHMGGIYLLEMLLVAKRCPNLFLNTAYTLLYFRESSIAKDLIYAINSLKSKKIFYGSDYPDREFNKTIILTKKEFSKYKLSQIYQNNIFYQNAKNFLKQYE